MKRPAFISRQAALPPHTVAVVTRPTPYGAAELKASMGPNMLRGLAAATVLFSLGLGTFAAVQARADDAPEKKVILVDLWDEPTPPPSIDRKPEVPQAAPPLAAPDAPKVGTPKPVPDDRADEKSTVADNRDLNTAPSSVEGVSGGQGSTEGSTVVGSVEVPIPAPPATPPPPPLEPKKEETPPPPPVENRTYEVFEVSRQPLVDRQVKPAYPDILRRAGIEGRVTLRVLVGTDGRVEEVQVLRSDNEGFNAATVEAVRQWRFTPAMQAGQPVRVWMTVPVRFRQQGD